MVVSINGHDEGLKMSVQEIRTGTEGLVGNLHNLECKEERSILIFQLPRRTDSISQGYLESAQRTLQQSLPTGRTALVAGCDVNVYELAEADAIVLKLKGLI